MASFSEDDIVISGVGGLFPKCQNLEQFKKGLLANEELLSSRWEEGERGVSNRMGCVDGAQYFDTSFFGIHRHQSLYMDPMQRITLERTFEALIDAGVPPSEVRGRKIGVYTGSSIGENDNVFYESIASGFGVTGHSRAMLSNRVSYWLNLKGPSCAYDNNWVSGFEVLQIAYNAIKAGHIEAAIVGTANLALNSEISWLYNDMGFLSPDGVTRPFDADANGYTRSDGVVVFFLQRASEAKRAYASIVNVGTRFYGNHKGQYLDKDEDGIASYLDEFISTSGVDPNDIEYLEAYGAGVKNIDEAEMNAIERVYCKNRESPLKVGSVKPNTGHAEPAAGMFSICKAIIAMESGTIPATLNFSKPNPNIRGFFNGNLEVVATNHPYNGGLIAVNGIGLSSNMGHIILKPNPRLKSPVSTNLPALVIASTRTEAGMKEVLDEVKALPTIDPEYVALTHSAFSTAINAHLFRGYAVVGGNTDVLEGCEYYTGNKRQIWFVYSGMGSQWSKMGNGLMELPIIGDSIRRSHDVLVPKGIDLINIITSEDPTIFDNILHAFVGIAAIQIALTDVLNALQIVPDGIIGHSVGELGCAYGDGALTAEEMILCAYSRGRASLEATLIQGMMAAVGLGYEQIKDMVPQSIEVACHNGPDSSTISGPTEDMEKFVKELQDKGIFARLVNVANIAYHSKYIKPAAPLLLKYLKDVIKTPRLRSPKWISTSAPESKWNLEEAKYSSAEYHTNNLLGSVLFEEGSRHIPKDSIVIEIAPHGLLQAILKRSLPSGVTNIPLTNRQAKNSLSFLMSAIGKMYLAGLEINPSPIFPKVDFPISRGTTSLSPLVRWEHGDTWRIGIEHKVNYLVGIKERQLSLNNEDFRECIGHQLNDSCILPAGSLVNLILNILETNLKTTISQFIVEDLRFQTSLTIPRIGYLPLFAIYQKGTGRFEVTSDDCVICTGILRLPGVGDEFFQELVDFKQSEDFVLLSGSDIYNEFLHRGHKYTGLYKSIKSMKLMEEGSITTFNATTKWQTLLEGMLQQVFFKSGEDYQKVVIPKSIQRIVISLEQLNTEQEDMEVRYNYSTGILWTNGIQITGVKAKPLPLKNIPVYYSSLEFCPFENKSVANIENVINASLELTLQNFHEPDCTSINITEIETNNPSLMDSLKTVIADYVELTTNISSAKDTNLHSLVSHNDPMLFVMNDIVNENVLRVLRTSEAFVLARTFKNILNYNSIVEFARFECNGDCFSLLRKVSTDIPKLVYVNDDVLTAREGIEESSWLTELKQATKNVKNKVYLVSKIQPLEGINNFVRELRSVEQFKHIRSLFLLDKNAPDISTAKEVYIELFKKDPIVSIFLNGQVGSNVSVPVSIKVNARNNLYSTSQMESKTIDYISVNLKDETITSTENIVNETGNLDYVSTNSQGESYFGLAYLDKDTCKFITDPILKWKVPKEFSLEDAVTIPHAYATAYYCLVLKGNLTTGETVLIHSGCTGIGLACIAIALSKGCHVYTTVANVSQRAYLKSKYYHLKDHNILTSQNLSFETQLMKATNGAGANVIINNLSGTFLQATTRCIAEFGRIIQIGKFDLSENRNFGMKIFLKYCSFFAVSPDTIPSLSNEEKQQLHELIYNGAYKAIVRPLRRRVATKEDIGDILSSLRDSNSIGKVVIKVTDGFQVNKLSPEKSSQYICDTKASYFIYGGSADIWADMAEWLIVRGARKIMISSDSKPQHAHINRRLSLLQTYFNADIIYAPAKVLTKENAAELLSEVYYLGPIHGVFFLPNKTGLFKSTDLKPLQHVEYALRTVAPKALVVNFVSLAGGYLQQRVEAGFPTYNVEWIQTLNFGQLLYSLDNILHLNVKNVQIKFERVTDFDQETTQMLYKKLALLLPSQEDIQENIDYVGNEIKMVQLPSLAPREIRAVPPVFIIPGLSNFNNIKEFARNLSYPVYFPKLPFTGLQFTDVAKILAEKIQQIYPKGPYNLVAISCGGGLAIEVARNLQKKANTQVTFVDAAPDSIQSCLKLIGEGTHGEINLLTRILNIDNLNVIESLQTSPNWEYRLETAVNSSTIMDKSMLKRLINSIKDQLQFVSLYQPSGELLTGKSFLVRPHGSSKFDNCGLLKYCKLAPEIEVISGDHATILLHKNLAELINKYVANQ